MFIPLHDANQLRHVRLQYVTIAMIALNVAVYLATAAGGWQGVQAAAIAYGYIPVVAFDHASLPEEFAAVPGIATYVTYAFLHADIVHLAGNMLFLWVFGDNVEDALGHLRFLFFYLACAVAGALLHGLVVPLSPIPLIGASGAVAGIVAAYLMLHPRVRIWILAFARIPLRVPAWIALVLWVGFQFAMLVYASEDEISWAAHVGGIVAGAVLVVLLKRREVPLFDRRVVTPQAAIVEPAPGRVPHVAPRSRGPWNP